MVGSKRLGVLHIRVHQARYLDKDVDTFIQITLGDFFTKSDVFKVSKNPEWQFQAKVDIFDDSCQQLEIKIMDEASKHAIGSATVDINEMMSKKQILNRWIKLIQSKTGEIKVSSHFVTSNEDEYKRVNIYERIKDNKQEEEKVDQVDYQKPVNLGKLNLIVHRASDLCDKDAVGKSDPYVVIYFKNRMFKHLRDH